MSTNPLFEGMPARYSGYRIIFDRGMVKHNPRNTFAWWEAILLLFERFSDWSDSKMGRDPGYPFKRVRCSIPYPNPEVVLCHKPPTLIGHPETVRRLILDSGATTTKPPSKASEASGLMMGPTPPRIDE